QFVRHREVGIGRTGRNKARVGVGAGIGGNGSQHGRIAVIQVRIDWAVTGRIVGNQGFPATDGVGTEQLGLGTAFRKVDAGKGLYAFSDIEITGGEEGPAFLWGAGQSLGIVPFQDVVL